jgi:hypothetical protein
MIVIIVSRTDGVVETIVGTNVVKEWSEVVGDAAD